VSGRTCLRDETAIASLVLPMLLWVATLVAVAVLDVAAYLVAAARAQTLADAAALAAVAPDIAPAGRSPVAEADRVVQAGGGWLETCTCELGTDGAEVTVSVPVPGLVIPRFGAARVSAEAAAVVGPPADEGPAIEEPRRKGTPSDAGGR
jgi:nitrate/nitrite transporter NarK